MNAAAGAGRGRLLVWLAVLWLVPSALCAAQPADTTTAYIERGRLTEARQRAYHERMEQLRQALAEALRQAAPDLLPRLEPTPPTAFGYGILPRIVPDAPPTPPVKPEVVRFSWVWSDTLIARENAALDRLEADAGERVDRTGVRQRGRRTRRSSPTTRRE